MANTISTFQEEHPSLESYWRSIILFGRNVASYKFALAKSLLEIIPTGQTHISLEKLAVPYSKYLCEHIASSPRQVVSQSSQFLDACKSFNSGSISQERLIDITVKKGFNNVIDAFHVVNNADIPIAFYEKDYSGENKQIVLTDNLFKLQNSSFYTDLSQEAEARWRLVETAWGMNISANLLDVNYDADQNLFYVDNNLRRKDVTSARDALNGYQKGKCFYCFDDITIDPDNNGLCDVDHFFPHILTADPWFKGINLDGVWNLVLACPNCNRGPKGKFAQVPAIKYLERLNKRNEFLINSYHPLRETLIKQTGATAQARHDFLASMDKLAINSLIQRWDTEQIGKEAF